MYPLTNSSCLTNAGKYECNVLHDGLLVRVENSATSSFVIALCSQKFGREILVRVVHYLYHDGKLAFCNLVLDGGDVKEPLPYLCISYSFLLHFCHCYPQNSSDTSVQEELQF